MTAACLLVRSPACSARQLQTSIVQVVHLCPTGFRKEPCERLERHKPKGLRVVLRGLGSSNAPRLPGGGGGNVTSLPDPQGSNPLGPPGPELTFPFFSVSRLLRNLGYKLAPEVKFTKASLWVPTPLVLSSFWGRCRFASNRETRL